MALPFWLLGAESNDGTPSWQVTFVGHVSSCSLVKWSEESRHFLRQLSNAKARQEPPLLQQRVRHAWLFRWGSMLACSGARALALSLLDVRGGQTDDVLWDARYVV